MGALTINRKRGVDYYSSIYPPLHSPNLDSQIDSHISKKPKISPSAQLNIESPVSSKKVTSRINLYPQPVNPLKREVHAPCRVARFGLFGSRNGARVVEKGKLVDETGNVLVSQYEQPKKFPIENLRFWKKDEEVIDVDEGTDKDDVSEDSSIEDVEIVENGVQDMPQLDEEGVENKLASEDLKVETAEDVKEIENEEKMLNLLSLNEKLRLMGLPIHKQLLESAESRNSKLSSLSFQIQLNEKRRAKLQLLRPVKQPVDEVVPRDSLPEPFVPLTEEEEAEVSRAFNSNRRKALVTHENSNIVITGEGLQCLKPKQWLNDEVINLYLELLKEREKREPKKFLKCHFFNTFFYKKLRSGRNGYDFKSVRRWTTQRKLGYCLLECDKIFVPIHKQFHWCLAVINKKDKKFQYLDSLGGTDSDVLEALARYYVDEVKDKSGEDIDVSSWMQEYVKDLPAQKNGYDCGVFMVKYTDFYSRGLDLCFNQDHMPYFRLRIAKEILRLKAE